MTYPRAVVHYAKIYIRPLQKSSSLDPLKEEVKAHLCFFLHGFSTIVVFTNSHIVNLQKKSA